MAEILTGKKSTDESGENDSNKNFLQKFKKIIPKAITALIIICIFIPSLFIVIYYQKLFWNFTCDDAYISFRYANNFAGGAGLVFNPGEKVEGFSNFLWTVLLGAVTFFYKDIVTLSKIFGFMSAMGLIIYSGLTAYLLTKKNKPVILPVSVLIAVNVSFAFYAGSGLETIFFGFLIIAGVFHYISGNKISRSLSFIFFMLVSLTRPEGIMYLAFLILYRIFDRIVFKKKFCLNEFITMAISILGVGLFILFRYLYYNDVFPNTYYAKTLDWILAYKFPWDGIKFTGQFLFDNGGIFLFPLCFLILKDKENISNFLLIIGVIFSSFAFMVYATFDWMSMHRFLIPIIGVLTCAAVAGAFAIKKDTGIIHSSIISILFTAAILLIFGSNQLGIAKDFKKNELDYPNRVMNSITLKEAGKDLKKRFEGKGTLVTKRLGAVPFYSELVTFDMFGLTDREIALFYHNYERKKRNPMLAGALLKRKPDYLLLYTGTMPKDPFKPTGDEIWNFSYPDCFVLYEAMKYNYKYVTKYYTGKGEWAYLYKR